MGWRSCSHRAGSIEASFQTSLQLNGLSASEQRHAYLVGPPPLNGPMWNGFKPSQPPPPTEGTHDPSLAPRNSRAVALKLSVVWCWNSR